MKTTLQPVEVLAMDDELNLTNDDVRQLAISLANCETEQEAVAILKAEKLWDDLSQWQDVGDNPSNNSVIGAQQSQPVNALVEKVVNSVDSILIRECHLNGIDPISEKAPISVADAQQEFFGIQNGRLSSLDASQRKPLSRDIYIVASGMPKENPSISIIDKGEGQSPCNFKNTFLSLTSSNKTSIQFVQGKFGMGSYGVFGFCGEFHNLQLIISKRNCSIASQTGESTDWGLTVVRMLDVTGLMKQPKYIYLAPKGEVLSFDANEMLLLPSNTKNSSDIFEPNKEPLKEGAFIKLYDYDLGSGRLRANITQHLSYQLSTKLPDIALPLTMVDTRYPKSPPKVMAGLSVRLDEDKRDNIEAGFPSSGRVVIDGEELNFSIVAFKPGKSEFYKTNEGVIFTNNGQVQGHIKKNIFDRKKVGMGYLRDSILVNLDCSKISRSKNAKLFMNNRESLRNTEFGRLVEKEIEQQLNSHAGLRALREERRRHARENAIKDNKTLEEVMTKISKSSPSILNLLGLGNRLANPFNMEDAGTQECYEGKEFPSFFTLSKNYPSDKPKECHLGSKFRIQFETDVVNDYFSRGKDPGNFTLNINGMPTTQVTQNLWNGIATLNISLPEDAKAGETYCYSATVTDVSQSESFIEEFVIMVVGPLKPSITKRDRRDRKDPTDDTSDGDRAKPTGFELPEPTEVYKDDDNYKNFSFNDNSALKVIDAGEGVYDYFINMANKHILTEMKSNPKIDTEIMKFRYKIGMVLFGMAMLKAPNKSSNTNDDSAIPIEDQVENSTAAISVVLLPLIQSLGELTLE